MVAFPENTMAAFRAAIELGADMIETDVRRTRDGHLVLLHDATLDRTTAGRGMVTDATQAEVHDLGVPDLTQLLDLADQTGTGLCIEVKGESPGEFRSVALEVGQLLARRGSVDRHVLASFDHECLLAAGQAVPGLVLAPDRLPERGAMAPDGTIAQVRRIGAQILQMHHAELNPALVDALHAADIAIWPWPVNLPEEVAAAQALGVDGLMGDDVRTLTAAVPG
jgi:glycerophosphoryl diester phosphodiesterase